MKLGARRRESEKAHGEPDEVEVRNKATTELRYDKLGLTFLLFNDKLVQMTASRVEQKKE